MSRQPPSAESRQHAREIVIDEVARLHPGGVHRDQDSTAAGLDQVDGTAPGQPDRFLLNADLHDLWYRKEVVTVRSDVPILFVSMDPYPVPDGKTASAESLLRPLNREMREVARFENIPMDLPHRVDSVVVFELSR